MTSIRIALSYRKRNPMVHNRGRQSVCHKFPLGGVINIVSTATDALTEMKANEVQFTIDEVFRAHYGRVARIIARVVRDPARAEELAVEVFLKLWRSQKAQAEKVEPWLYRVASSKVARNLRVHAPQSAPSQFWS